MTIKIKGWLTYAQVAKRLSIQQDTVRKYVLHGVFDRDVLEGSQYPLISEESVVKFEKNRKGPGNPTFKRKR